LRSPLKYNDSKKIWRVLGFSEIFKLDLMKNNKKTEISFNNSHKKNDQRFLFKKKKPLKIQFFLGGKKA